MRQALGTGAVLVFFGGAVAAETAPTTLPQGGVVSQGAAGIRGGGTAGAPVLNIDQGSQRAVINWNTFNLGSAGTVNFNQPNAQSATLNRVLDMQPSQIMGHIHAPGQVTLVNPAGVYFGPGAVLDVGALTASTMQQSDADFMAGIQRFQRAGSTGRVVNEGVLTASGHIALLAPEVRNQGTVTASAVAMASGESIQLHFDAFSRLASLTVTPSQIAALVANRTAVLAPGGLVILSAQALRGLQASVINSGQIDASSLASRGGRIVLEGDSIALKPGSNLLATGATGGGTVLVGGDWQGSGDMAQASTVVMDSGAAIDASATHSGDGGRVVLWSDVSRPASQTLVHGRISARGGAAGGNGGQVETSGHYLDVSGAVVSASAAVGKTGRAGRAGEWLLDPTDITITDAATTPGVLDTGNPAYTATATSNVSAADISATLSAGTSVTVQTSAATAGAGDITVNTPTGITHSGAGAVNLTLKAHNNIALTNSVIRSTGGPLNVVLNSDFDGNSLGAIGIDAGSSIVTLGGNITLGGGTAGTGIGTAHGAGAMRQGIAITGATLNAGGGDIAMKGTGISTGSADSVGVLLTNAGITTSGAGRISVSGATGLLTGTGSDGVRMAASTLGNTGGGGITVSGTVNENLTGIANDSLALRATDTDILASSGAIDILTTGGNAGLGAVFTGGNLGFKAASAVPASSSNITLTATNVAFPTTPTHFATTGQVVMQPSGSEWDGRNPVFTAIDVAPTASGLRIGRPATTNGLFALPALSIDGPIDIRGGHLTINGLVSTGAQGDIALSARNADLHILGPVTVASGRTLSMTVLGRADQSASGNITADSLLLGGAGSYALTAASNNRVGTIAGVVSGSIGFLNNGALTIGTVGTTKGISASGRIAIATHTGDLTLAQSVVTVDATADAMLLNAGQDSAAGTATGGNLVIGGGVNVGVGFGGTARLMTGSIGGSTGLAALVGPGSGRFRYNSDEVDTHYTLALGSGFNAIYREAPAVLNVTVNDASKVYDGQAFSGGNGVALGAPSLHNGDKAADVPGGIVYGGAAQGALNVAGGPYVLTADVASQLGYLFTYTNGRLDIAPRPVGLLGSRVYDGTRGVAAGIFTASSGVGGETLGVTGAGAVASRDAGTGKAVTLGSLALADGSGLASNYTLAGATADIAPATLTVSTGSVSKVFDGGLAAPGAAIVESGTLFAPDSLSGGVFAFVSSDVGTGKTVTTSGVTVNDGNGGRNYLVSYADNMDSAITPLPPVPEPPPLPPLPHVPPLAPPPPWTTVPDYVLPPAVLIGPPRGLADAGQASGGRGDDWSVFPAIGSTTTVAGTAPTFACEGAPHAEPDCGNRQPAGAYVVVTPLRGVSPSLSGKVMVQVGPDVLRTGAFSTALPEEATQALRAQATRAVVSMADGQPLPAWLSFDARTFSMAAHAMPPGALPVTVLVRKGVYEVEVEISSLKQAGAAGPLPGK